jgi:hypothetical protein
MISSGDIRPLFSLTRDLIAVQTYAGLSRVVNVVAAHGFDATKGLGTAEAGVTTMSIVHAGGFDDQKLTARMTFESTTSTANSDIMVCVRVQSKETSPSGANVFYSARQDGDVARISYFNGTTYSTLTSTAHACAADQIVEISLQVVGNALTATFENVTANPGVVTTLSATDSTITGGGLMGFRSLSSSIRIRSFTAEQL